MIPPPPHSIPPFDDSFFLPVSWVVPIFALDSVSQVRLIPSISTLLHVLGEFFVKIILLHDTDTHRNDRVEGKNRDYEFYFSFPFSRREREVLMGPRLVPFLNTLAFMVV